MDYTQFFNHLKQLISYKSVLSKSEENAPFGVETKNALEFFLRLANQFGFETINYDNYGGEIIYGEGEEVGIIGHLDVVPVSPIGWETDPFTLTEKDGKLYGRGTEDNKTPNMLMLYALKELKEKGVKFNRKIRFIVGCNEESGWKDVEYMQTKTTFPDYGFSPDSNFPLSYAEKGVYHIKITLPNMQGYLGLTGGNAVNSVCDYASITAKSEINQEVIALLNSQGFNLKIDENRIESVGKTAHGAHPEKGKNAFYPLFIYLEKVGELPNGIANKLFENGTDICNYSTEQGKLTFSPNLVKNENGNTLLVCDCRVPAPLSIDQVKHCFDKIGLPVEIIEKHPPFMVEKEGWLVEALCSAYNAVTGENNPPVALCGSTFARCFKHGCAFGPGDDIGTGGCHEANEYITKAHLLKCYEIYKQALLNLVK